MVIKEIKQRKMEEKQEYKNYVSSHKKELKREYAKNINKEFLESFFVENYDFTKDLNFGRTCKKEFKERNLVL